MARERSDERMADSRIARLTGAINAAPTPSRARAARSQPTLGAAAHAQRREREERHAAEQHPPLSELVAQGTTEQDDGGHRQGVRTQDPLQRGEPQAEVVRHGGQCESTDGPVDGEHARAEDADRDDEAAGPGGQHESVGVHRFPDHSSSPPRQVPCC